MAKQVALASRHERGGRRIQIEEPIARRRATAVMPGLQQSNGRGRLVPSEHGLEFRPGVPGEQDLDKAETQAQHDGVVIAHATSLPVGDRRMQDVNHNTIDLDLVSCLQASPDHARRGSTQVLHQLELRDRHTFPHLPGPEVLNNTRGTTEVIHVAMGNRQPVQPADT